MSIWLNNPLLQKSKATIGELKQLPIKKPGFAISAFRFALPKGIRPTLK